MAYFSTLSGRKTDSRTMFAIHEDLHNAEAENRKDNSSTHLAPLTLSTSTRGNIQRGILNSGNDGVPIVTDVEKPGSQKAPTEARGSKLDEKAHKNLLEALEQHCSMGKRVPSVVTHGNATGEVGLFNKSYHDGQSMKENHDPLMKRSVLTNAIDASASQISYDGKSAPNEMQQLKLELQAAKQKIATQEQELTMARTSHNSSSIGLMASEGSDSADEFSNISMLGLCNDVSSFDLAEPTQRQDVLTIGANHSSQFSAHSPSSLVNRSSYDYSLNSTPFLQGTTVWNEPIGRNWSNRYAGPATTPLGMLPQQAGGHRDCMGSRPNSPVAASNRSIFKDLNPGNATEPRRLGSQLRRWTSGQNADSRRETWDTGPATDMYNSTHYGHMFQPSGPYQQSNLLGARPIGTALSPTALEFTTAGALNPWNSAPTAPSQTYVSTTEPINYRRLLDRSVSCNWKYIVDKIVCSNDQQASIFLQQKLKIGTVEQKFDIVEAIVAQAYPLMVNRFGNFLIQRCFEHGTPEQVVAIANAIRGNTLSLSMDAFGCHVVQKAFDAVPEEYKAIMVHELLRRIPETVIHRYACHVWQKLFELRWSDSPPQIMKHVNEALRGMWHEVALGETGSLVVQNIFENCLEEDKRPCIDEVLKSIDVIAHGQFGNWCIQHICEHGATADRGRAIDHVLCYASEYSMDQFASKVVEKCLKIGGNEFLERYLERVCEGRADRPRIPLIDIASDQYGNYLIQYILTHASGSHREVVASHIRKHMVSLRGSKFGSRVGMLCSNPAYATRPGPGVATSNTRFANNNPAPRYQGHFR